MSFSVVKDLENLNNSLTKDQNYIIKNENLVCRFILETSPFSAVNQKENSKKYFKNLQKFTINYANHIAKEKRQQRINLENQLKILEKCLDEDDNLNKHNAINSLTLFRMGFFGAAHGWRGGAKRSPLPKICHTYPTMMKLGSVIPLRKIQKIYESRDTTPVFC